jgi:hypothetical protein
MTVRGRVVAFDEWTMRGVVVYDLEAIRFHSTCFHAYRSPRIGEPVDIVFNETGQLLALLVV